MTKLFVGMDIGAVIPRSNTTYDSIVTHGIDSCTGVAVVSSKHIFLAHIGPPPKSKIMAEEDKWYLTSRDLIDNAIQRMEGSITSVVIISPNEEGLIKDDGPRMIQDRFDIFFSSSIDCKAIRERGNSASVGVDGRIAARFGSFPSSETTTIPMAPGKNLVLIT